MTTTEQVILSMQKNGATPAAIDCLTGKIGDRAAVTIGPGTVIVSTPTRQYLWVDALPDQINRKNLELGGWFAPLRLDASAASCAC